MKQDSTCVVIGSIPARAGQPCYWGWLNRLSRSIPARAGQPVYPRTRGATARFAPECYLPRRSIPARAGQPAACVTFGHSCSPVYPRTRGATTSSGSHEVIDEGLSPHARGNRLGMPSVDDSTRSIPARAGQPRPIASWRSRSEVYPRTRGATLLCSRRSRPSDGLSPHARGNHLVRRRLRRRRRSIPARAGQPRIRPRYPYGQQVYPRTRGATTTSPPPAIPSPGLSPHARGNQVALAYCSAEIGSIPARAGQPAPPRAPLPEAPVYPRTRKSGDARGTPTTVYPRTRGATRYLDGFPQ